MGNIVQSAGDAVHGVVHECDDEHLAVLDTAEGYGHGYLRVEVPVQTDDALVTAVAYVGKAPWLDDDCLPTQRYLNILVRGALNAGLDDAYIEQLRRHPQHVNPARPPFEHPTTEVPSFDAAALEKHPTYTALAGAVFDMKDARSYLDFHKVYFGGRDMTLYHLKRLDSSDGGESLEQIKSGRFDTAQRVYLDEYLRTYDAEFLYVGRFTY